MTTRRRTRSGGRHTTQSRQAGLVERAASRAHRHRHTQKPCHWVGVWGSEVQCRMSGVPTSALPARACLAAALASDNLRTGWHPALCSSSTARCTTPRCASQCRRPATAAPAWQPAPACLWAGTAWWRRCRRCRHPPATAAAAIAPLAAAVAAAGAAAASTCRQSGCWLSLTLLASSTRLRWARNLPCLA